MIYIFIISIIIIVIAFMIMYLFYLNNKLGKLHDMIKDEYMAISIMLKKRNDLIPKLIEIVKEYPNREQELLDEIAEVRNYIIETNVMEEIIYYDYELSNGINKLLIKLEKNKKLKSNADYINVRQELSDVEKNINEKRSKYNEIVSKFNKQILTLPGRIIVKKKNYHEENCFKIE